MGVSLRNIYIALLLCLSSWVLAYEQWKPSDNQSVVQLFPILRPNLQYKFRFDTSVTNAQKAWLKSSFEDMFTVVNTLLKFNDDPGTQDAFDVIMQKYFPKEQKSWILRVFRKFVERNKNTEAFPLDSVYFFTDYDGTLGCVTEALFTRSTYNTWERNGKEFNMPDEKLRSNITFCHMPYHNFYQWPLLKDVGCPNSKNGEKYQLDSYVSSKMLVSGAGLIHEST